MSFHSQTKPGSSKFAKLCKTERLEHAGVFTPKLNLALPNLPSSPRQNAWSTLEFSETRTNLVLRTAALVCKQRPYQETSRCRNP